MIVCPLCQTVPEQFRKNALLCDCGRLSFNSTAKRFADGKWTFGPRRDYERRSEVAKRAPWGMGGPRMGRADRGPEMSLRTDNGRLRWSQGPIREKDREKFVADFVADLFGREVVFQVLAS